ncbi:hypothetical protein [Acinetobacter sp. MD2(2019)]|uniref:hypothetical protein n=1 Tax=Acinetobacter sp. MD2(2019) TaxID=2605273 RepID=UPI002D1E58C5|nr:hypothetical protein [Acinetobacter sp. MD2(2019)]MEB3754191.1 hypothetical protein [Acinetobacter sp. MD2(2019)]
MKSLLFFILIIVSSNVSASYVNSCELIISLVNDSSIRRVYINKDGVGEVEEMQLVISGVVKDAYASGRADSGCQQYIGKHIDKTFSHFPNNLELKSGEKIKVNIFIKDGQAMPRSETTTYLQKIQ